MRQSKKSVESAHPKVGVGVIVRKDGKVLLQKRKGSHGEGTWSFPGGHLEFTESIEACAKRETMEEMNIKIKNVRIVSCTNDVFRKEHKHYLTVFVVCDYASGKLKIREQDKSEEIKWAEWNSLPKPLFLPIKNLLKTKYDPFKKIQLA